MHIHPVLLNIKLTFSVHQKGILNDVLDTDVETIYFSDIMVRYCISHINFNQILLITRDWNFQSIISLILHLLSCKNIIRRILDFNGERIFFLFTDENQNILLDL